MRNRTGGAAVIYSPGTRQVRSVFSVRRVFRHPQEWWQITRERSNGMHVVSGQMKDAQISLGSYHSVLPLFTFTPCAGWLSRKHHVNSLEHKLFSHSFYSKPTFCGRCRVLVACGVLVANTMATPMPRVHARRESATNISCGNCGTGRRGTGRHPGTPCVRAWRGVPTRAESKQRGGIGIRSTVGTTHTPLNLYRSGPLSRSSTEMNSFNFFKSSEPFKMIE